MESKITAPDGTRREVTIELTKDELKPHYDEAYQRAQASITLPGFRKGKVPVNIIKQRLGREIENEALETIADAEFRKYAKSNDLKVVGNPALTDIRKSQEGVGFTIEFEVMPEFELGNYRDLTVNRPVKNISDDDVQAEIDRICLRAASFEPADVVTGSLFVVTYTLNELDPESSMPILGKEAREERVFLDDDQVDMHLRNSMNEKKVGDSFTYVAETQDANATPPSYRVTITDIQKVVPAAFTNEFVETITGGKFTSTEEVRDDIRAQITEYFERASRDSVENQIVDQIVNAHEFDAPGALVHAVVHQLFDDFKTRNEGAPGLDKLTAHDVEDDFRPSAERIVRWELIRAKIIEAESIEVQDADVAEAAEKYGVTEEQLRMVMRQNRNLADQIMADKVMKLLVNYAVINDVNVDSDFETVS